MKGKTAILGITLMAAAVFGSAAPAQAEDPLCRVVKAGGYGAQICVDGTAVEVCIGTPTTLACTVGRD